MDLPDGEHTSTSASGLGCAVQQPGTVTEHYPAEEQTLDGVIEGQTTR